MQALKMMNLGNPLSLTFLINVHRLSNSLLQMCFLKCLFQIGTDGSVPDCPYDDHCEDWGEADDEGVQ